MVSSASRSRSEYESRMHLVLAHIDAHIDQPLDLSALADVACFPHFTFIDFLPHGWVKHLAIICAVGVSRWPPCGLRLSLVREF